MTVSLDLVSEARNAYEKLRTSRVTNHAIVLRPNPSSLAIELEAEYAEGKCLDDIADTLPGNDTRLIVMMPERVYPDGIRKSYPIILISYCPQGLPPQVNVVHSNARTMVMKEFQLTMVWDVKKKLALGDESLVDKLAADKW
jgi:hypothetical protein